MSGEEGQIEGSSRAALHFPESALVPETKLHLELRTLLYLFLKRAFADHALLGCDQFVYWDPNDPSACLAPDACLRFGERDVRFGSWKVWERGTPELVVELLSDSDRRSRWQEKLSKYARLGIHELVTFDAEAPEPKLRLWDSTGSSLVERDLARQGAASSVVPGHWLVVSHPLLGPTLRLSRDGSAGALFPTPEEALETELSDLRRKYEHRT
jgi:hypothetical protein